VEKKILSLPVIIATVGAYIGIFELNLIGVTSLLLYYIRHRHNNVGILVQYYIQKSNTPYKYLHDKSKF